MSQREPKLEMIKANALASIQAKRFADARALLVEVCEADARDGQAWFLLGAVNGQLRQFEAAADCLRRAVELDPTNTEARYNLGQATMHLGRYEDAIACYDAVLRGDPGHVGARGNRDLAQAQLRRRGAPAGRQAQTSAVAGPELERIFDAGYRLLQQKKWVDARTRFLDALRLAPDHFPSLANLGVVCQELGDHQASVGYLERALRIRPDLAASHFALGNAFKELMRLPEAETSYRRALELDEGHVRARHNLGIVLMMQGMVREAEATLRQVLEREPGNLDSRSGLLAALNYADNDPQCVYREYTRWDRAHGLVGGPRTFPRLAVDPGRRLRVGYVSPDFRAHPVAFFVAPLLANHDPHQVETVGYSDVAQPDTLTSHLRGLAAAWSDVRGMSDEALAERIRRDRVDILVDLAGHTAGHRLGVFARRAAPVQVTYLGYPNTTGLAEMDYRLTDAWADPPGSTEHLHTERLVRLPEGFLCYRPLEGTTVSEPPFLHAGHVTFGSFNNMAKVTPEVIALWARLLRSVPGSHLFLKYKGLGDAAIRARVHGLFREHGVEPQRVELCGWLEAMRGHMESYARVDIALDSFPYNGTTTTCEALWMGVPVVTLAGRVHAGRVGISLLTQVGLQECIAQSPEEYVALAAGLAAEPARLSVLRQGLRDRVARSSLCDGARFARHVEAAYRVMWQQWCAGPGT